MPARVGVNLRASAYLHQGDRKYMEDEFVAAYQRTPDKKDIEYAFFGIFDGHGGKEAANFAKDNLMDNIVSQRLFWSDDDEDILDAIKQGFIQTHLAMLKVVDTWPRTASGWPSTSGSTASVAFIRRQKIYIGHVGDSGIVMGEKVPDKSNWSGWQMTADHKPEDCREKKRIGGAGGRVVNKGGVPRVVWQRPRRGHKGPVRRSTPMEEIPFLAVARSLGDLWSYNSSTNQFVVSPVPDVHHHTIDLHKHRCLILGTDGLWNVMSPFVAANIAQASERNNEMHALGHHMENGQPYMWVNPSRSVVKGALERYSRCSVRADNTSAVVVYLDPPGRPKRELLQERRAAEVSPKRVPLNHVPAEPRNSDVKVNVYNNAPDPAPSSPSAYSMLRIKERIADESWRDEEPVKDTPSPVAKPVKAQTQAPTPGTMAALHGEDANPVAMEDNLRRQALLGRSSSAASAFSSPNSAFASPSLRSSATTRLSLTALPGTPVTSGKREREPETAASPSKKKKAEVAQSPIITCSSAKSRASEDIQSPVVTSSSVETPQAPKRPREKRLHKAASVSPKKTRHSAAASVEETSDAERIQALSKDSSKCNNNNSTSVVANKLVAAACSSLAVKKSIANVTHKELKTVRRDKAVKRLDAKNTNKTRMKSHAKLSIAKKIKKKGGLGVAPRKKSLSDTGLVSDCSVKMNLRSDKSMQTRSADRKKSK